MYKLRKPKRGTRVGRILNLEIMNSQEYEIKNNNNEIRLNVVVSVNPGALITPTVNLYIDAKKLPKEELEDSEDMNYFFLIGKANKLEYGLIKVELVFDLNLINDEQWQNYFDNMAIEYHLSGGEKKQKFNHQNSDIKVKSTNGRMISTEKKFLLIYPD